MSVTPASLIALVIFAFPSSIPSSLTKYSLPTALLSRAIANMSSTAMVSQYSSLSGATRSDMHCFLSAFFLCSKMSFTSANICWETSPGRRQKNRTNQYRANVQPMHSPSRNSHGNDRISWLLRAEANRAAGRSQMSTPSIRRPQKTGA